MFRSASSVSSATPESLDTKTDGTLASGSSTLFAMGISGPSTLSKTTTATAPASSAFRTCGYGDGSVRVAGRDAFVGDGKKTSEKKLAGGRFSVLNEPW